MSRLSRLGSRRSNWAWALCMVILTVLGIALLYFYVISAAEKTSAIPAYIGSASCRSCHEKFYQLWAPSHHGLAMQPYTEVFAKKNLTPQDEEITIESCRYQAIINKGAGFVMETGPDGQKKYPMLHVLGGKYVYYFLTELERGYLQVLPVAFDIRRQKWYDTAASGVRHFPGRDEDEPLNWKDRPYTFNSSCYGCHVSQLVKNYDSQTDTYNTQWKEPGINCETCHGPAAEHVKICLEAEAQGKKPKEMKLETITQNRGYTAHQVNTACLTCHSKAVPITSEFVPGEDFFQHYDLVTLEHPDYYPDGRDLGENYTCTSWMLSPCVNAGQLDCMYCHTSSGRYRFKGQTANDACVKCHTGQRDIATHSHHDTDSGVTECIQCHMPKTEFGRMIRSDHSMRPPMPAATIRFKSPNACNLCHQDQNPEWADEQVRKWHSEDYQKPVLEMTELIAQARRENWENLSVMLDTLEHKDRDVVFVNSLIRLLEPCDDSRIPAILTELVEKDPSPLIRASAAHILRLKLQPSTVAILTRAASDPYRLVRIRAAAALAVVAQDQIPSDKKQMVQKATDEFIASMNSRPDDAPSHYNLGNFYRDQNQLDKAIESYEFAIRLDKQFILPYVNVSLVYNRVGQNEEAVKSLTQAIQIDRKNYAAHLNLALLYGEMGRYEQAQVEFLKTLELDPNSAVAAYNLCVLLGDKNPIESIRFGRKAVQLQPDHARYAYTLAFYLYRTGQIDDVIQTLEPFVSKKTLEANIYLLLAGAFEQKKDWSAAIRVYQAAAENNQLPEQVRSTFRSHLRRLTLQ